MAAELASTLQTTDWNEEWKRLQVARGKADDVAFWNQRAATYGSETPGAYTRAFMELACVLPGETILDMGCGSGNLAIPYAQQGHGVIAADFSPAMLDLVEKQARKTGLSCIQTRLLSWQDDWEAAGLAPRSVDVALASRSIATNDMRDALLKLSSTARRRCCITLTTSSSPHVDTRVLDACGVTNTHGMDFQYAFNILLHEGFFPECSYITSERKDTFDSLEEAFAKLDRMLTRSVGENDHTTLEPARARLAQWLEDNLVENEEAGVPDGHHEVQKAYRLTHNRHFTWAFIAWNARR